MRPESCWSHLAYSKQEYACEMGWVERARLGLVGLCGAVFLVVMYVAWSTMPNGSAAGAKIDAGVPPEPVASTFAPPSNPPQGSGLAEVAPQLPPDRTPGLPSSIPTATNPVIPPSPPDRARARATVQASAAPPQFVIDNHWCMYHALNEGGGYVRCAFRLTNMFAGDTDVRVFVHLLAQGRRVGFAADARSSALLTTTIPSRSSVQFVTAQSLTGNFDSYTWTVQDKYGHSVSWTAAEDPYIASY